MTRRAALHRCFSTCRFHQGADITLTQLHKGATLQAAWQHHGAIADTNQAADGVADSLKHTSHFAVASLRNGHAVPTVRAFTTALFDRTKLSWPIVELDARDELFFLVFTELAQRAHCVFALQTKAGVHQLVGQFT